jgi:hypothetical protein
MTLAALRSEAAVGKTLTLAGPTAYTTKQVRCLLMASTSDLSNSAAMCAWAVSYGAQPQACRL